MCEPRTATNSDKLRRSLIWLEPTQLSLLHTALNYEENRGVRHGVATANVRRNAVVCLCERVVWQQGQVNGKRGEATQ